VHKTLMTSTVAIINWNSGTWLRLCIESLLATTTIDKILVIDNASADASLEPISRFRERITLVRNCVNRGFAAAVNQAFHLTTSSCLLILNPDVRAMPGAVQILEEFMHAHPRVGAAGGYTGDRYLPKSLPTITTLVRENLGLKVQPGRGSRPPCAPRRVEQPAAAALMIRRDAHNEVEGFDEQFYPAWYEDVDFCLRLKAKGWELYFVPDAHFIHEGGYSAQQIGARRFLQFYYENQLRYARKHFGGLGAATVRASIAAGMIERMIAKPTQARAYGQVLIRTLKG
jgi:N-acetylglucosaminyl-diphospho-decaprenol L-rhamnosyltransferase